MLLCSVYVKETGNVFNFFFFDELCQERVMVAYTKPQKRKKEESEQLRGERDKIKFIHLRFEKQV